MSALLTLSNVSICFPEKTCLQGLNARVHEGDRIALVGDNGSGKSSLLRAIAGETDAEGQILSSEACRIGYLPQRTSFAQEETAWQALQGVNEAQSSRLLSQLGLWDQKEQLASTLSGGEQMRLSLAKALANSPNVLLLDEPTNHLSSASRRWLFQFLQSWTGAFLVASHDRDLLRFASSVWHLDRGCLTVYQGTFEAFEREQACRIRKEQIRYQELCRSKRQASQAAQKEEERRARTAKQGKKRWDSDKIMRDKSKERAERTAGSGHKRRVLAERKQLAREIAEARIKPTLKPTFTFCKAIGSAYLEVRSGAVGFGDQIVAENIHLSAHAGDRIAIRGSSGSGKTTLLRALFGDVAVVRHGEWRIPASMGYLDQHYASLAASHTVWDCVRNVRLDWPPQAVIAHLNRFLFVHHATFQRPVYTLSEGEKARLLLCRLAADPRMCLLLDEVTNNLDLTAKDHLAEVLATYEGILIVVSHEEAFLEQIGVQKSIFL